MPKCLINSNLNHSISFNCTTLINIIFGTTKTYSEILLIKAAPAAYNMNMKYNQL